MNHLTEKIKNSHQKICFLGFFVLLSFFIIFPVNWAEASDITSQTVINIVNKERVGKGLDDLSESSLLDKAALDKVNDMIKNDYFAHTSPGGTSSWYWFEKNGYDYKYAGENLAINFDNAEGQHEAWMKSETHRRNILNPNYQEIGVAVAQGKIDGQYVTLTVQLFGTTMTGIFSQNNKNPAFSDSYAKVAEYQSDVSSAKTENLIPAPEETKIVQLDLKNINIGHPVCQKGFCYFSENENASSLPSDFSRPVALILVISLIAAAIFLNTLLISREEHHNPFVAANTVMLIMVLTSIVLWGI
jgi:hypothetical protein